ncbi:MAG: adenosine deaminase [Elusimicrobia bacterium]|nr:adenosine deaminase [Elusimicrobiota bacterium]
MPAAIRDAASEIAWDRRSVRALVEGLPKAELHLHLDGSLSPRTVQRLAREQGYAPLKDKSLAELRASAVARAPKDSLAEVLEVFKTIYPLLHRAEALERVAFELAAEAGRQNIRYLEARFAPCLNAGPELRMHEAVEAVLAGLARGEERFGVGWGAILCLLRPPLASRSQNEETVELAVRYKGRGVVAVDLAGDEAAAPLSDYRDLFERAKGAGLSATVHAGEVEGSRDLETAVELGVDRLGHALRLPDSPELLERIAALAVPVEVNLTSNLRTGGVSGYARHPARDFFRRGIPIALSTDDPGIFDIDLNGEYLLLSRELGFTPADLIAVALQGAEASFAPPARRRALRRRFEDDISLLLAALRRPG